MAKRVTRRQPVSGHPRERIGQLARNLWWTWNPEAQRVFAALDPVQWTTTNHDPLATLRATSDARLAQLEASTAFTKQLAAVEGQFAKYLKNKTWFERTARGRQRKLCVAYFCAEFGLHESFPQYSGGLGVLAGDHLKSASDLGIPLIAVGLLYRNGYYRQAFDDAGRTLAEYPTYDFAELPVEDTGKFVPVPLGKRYMLAKIWRLRVGRTSALLLDTDIPPNKPRDRAITQRLYGGDSETRIQQEIVLGIGGVRALEALGHKPTVFHLNEGHAAFCALERLRQLRKQRLSHDKAIERVRKSTVFTTHTPVPAGHDRFDPKLTMRYLGALAGELDLSREPFLALGRENPKDRKEPFCMTVLALNLSAHRNGVAKIHGEVSREMWLHVHDVATADDVPIGYVTNGVHTQTWLASEMAALYAKHLKPNWLAASPEQDWWEKAAKIPADELWATRGLLRAKLVHFIRQRLTEQVERRVGPLAELSAAIETFDEDALTIGFARRFATYKRAPLIFKHAKRLAAILGDTRRPVQLVFAGKAHPADAGGQAFAQQIYKHAHAAGLRGRVALIENYDMHVGRMLTSGCDVWLNNPLRPREASGTSGMKPPLHGGLNCSIPDGWWPEAYDGKNGWQIGDGRQLKAQAKQDAYDVNAIYDLLENGIVPKFYKRGRDGLPREWIRLMQHSIASVGRQFNTHRMVGDYVRNYYWPANS